MVTRVAMEQPSSGDPIAPNSGVIKVYVRELNQLFDSMDPSPFHERDLDRSAHEYIVGTARELPAGAPTALVVYLAQHVGMPNEGHLLGEAIRVYFLRQWEIGRRRLRQRLRWGWINLAVGVVLLVASVVVGQSVKRTMGDGPFATVLRESLLIGGWVAMWRPMDFFLYELWETRAELRIYERLGRLSVQIVYTAADPVVAPAGQDGTTDDRRRPSVAGRPAESPQPTNPSGSETDPGDAHDNHWRHSPESGRQRRHSS